MKAKEHNIKDGYKIMKDGTIIGIKSKKPLSQYKNHRGYRYVRLSTKDGNMANFTVHRLVAWKYINDYSIDKQVDHIDGNKDNNDVSNLRMVTNSENQLHAIKLGKKPANQKRVGKYSLDGELLEEFDNGKLAALSVGKKDQSNILRVCRGGRPSAFGFIWKFL